MGRKSAIYKKGYEHTDFSYLLDEFKGPDNCIANEDEEVSFLDNLFSESVDTLVESEERHRIMSDEKVKYLYSKQSKVIHEKHCLFAKVIDDEELEWSEQYIGNMQPCPECMIHAYIVAGAKDPKEINLYQQFFEKAGMTEKHIRNIYVENKMKTRIAPDIITIWHKEDTWRIKTLPKKGHVQLYHNNYTVKKNGIREFSQGFHIQSFACEDTDINYALSIIKKYEYKPEEYDLHSNVTNINMRKKAKQKQMQKMEENVVPLEELFNLQNEELAFAKKVSRWFMALFVKKKVFEFNGFHLVSEKGYPQNQTVCIYIWKNKNGKILWQTGMYNKKLEHFSVRYGTSVYAIRQSNVIAWKKMTEEAMILRYN